MKWYFSINEAATTDQVGLHAKIAVLSALRFSTLEPHLLYLGERNDFTDWMSRHGVKVIDYTPSFTDYVLDLDKKGVYSKRFLRHWLRTGICKIEEDEAVVLYTDCDVIFIADPTSSIGDTKTFSCAPEFLLSNWNYFNSGVMLMNIDFLDRTYDEFEAFIKEAMVARGSAIRDQYSYNTFYRGKWERLPPSLNWKPYWGKNLHASIIHFHGAKLDAILAILNNRWNWSGQAAKQIGSLFAGHALRYTQSLQCAAEIMADELPAETELIMEAIWKIKTFKPPQEVNLDFMNFRMS